MFELAIGGAIGGLINGSVDNPRSPSKNRPTLAVPRPTFSCLILPENLLIFSQQKTLPTIRIWSRYASQKIKCDVGLYLRSQS